MKVTKSCPTLCNPMDCSLWNSPDQNIGVCSLSLLQGIFLITTVLGDGWADISHFEEGLYYSYHSFASGQTTGREHSPTYQQKIGLKIY